MEEDCRKCAEDSGIRLPENFSVKHIFDKALSAKKINYPMLQAALTLKKKGKDPVLADLLPNCTRTLGNIKSKCAWRAHIFGAILQA